ncbi:MAG: 4Fe-4S dicluster domain-containing protein [Candidatus Omnitrophica bacterium]|nr:4Fe-4S dicluster domain-containing protein [Candidatus Omnitrophota bacterium]
MDNLILAAILSMAGLSVAFAAVLAFADKKLRVEEDPRIAEVLKHLPHVNCGACGYLNCHDFAEHVIKEGEDPAKCKPLGEEAQQMLYDYLGKEGKEKFPRIALVHCAAEYEHKKTDTVYTGVKTCIAANAAFGGGMECEYGCMGFGDCVEVCPFGAMHMEKGLPRVDAEKCTGCGKCAEACPRGIISIQQKKYDDLYYVACSSHDDMMRVRKICSVGCIACGICEKLSPEKYFEVKDNLSYPNFEKQSDREELEKIAPKCPTKVIKKA